MRDLSVVIAKMLTCIPHSEVSLRSELESNDESYQYSAPELCGLRWQNTAGTLEDHLDPEDCLREGWQKKVLDIWMGRE